MVGLCVHYQTQSAASMCVAKVPSYGDLLYKGIVMPFTPFSTFRHICITSISFIWRRERLLLKALCIQ